MSARAQAPGPSPASWRLPPSPSPAWRRQAALPMPRLPKAVRCPCSCELEVPEDEAGDALRVVEVEQRQPGLDLRVARHGDDVRIVRVQERLAGLGAPDFQLRDRRVLVALHQQQVAGGDVLHLLLERRLRGAAQLVHQHPAPRGRDQDLARAGLAMAVGVLSFLVDVESMVGMLDERNTQAALNEARDELLDQGRLAAPRPARESEGFHAVAPPQELPAPAVQPRQWSSKRMRRPITCAKSKSKMLSGLPLAPIARSSSIWLKSQS